jgi:tetratricopeptide (TPR) repeat protein
MFQLVAMGNRDSAFDLGLMAAFALMAAEADPTERARRTVIATADKALALDAKSASMHLLRGAVRFALEESEAGLRDINRAVTLTPHVPDRQFTRREIERSASSRRSLQTLLLQATARRFPGAFVNPASVTDVGVGLIGHGPSFKVSDWTRVIERDPKSSMAYFMRGVSAIKKDRFDQGLYDFERSLRLSPIQDERFFRLVTPLAKREFAADSRLMPLLKATAQSAKDEDRAAVATLRDLLNRYPDFAAAQAELAWVLATSPDPGVRDGTTAVELAQRAVVRDSSGRNSRALAAALAETGDFQRAVEVQEQALAQTRMAGDVREDYSVYLTAYQIGLPWRKNQ